jgi:outer membrane protein OmpA-like peptidoglycan-associated protein
MIRRTFPLAASFWLVSALAAAAQIDNGTEVRVNPQAMGGRDVLLYPGGEFMRVVPQLRQPGERGGEIRLHMPTRRAVRIRSADEAVAETPAPRPPRIASAAPAPKPAPEPPRDTSGYVSDLAGDVQPGATGLFKYTGPSQPQAPSTPAKPAPPKPAPNTQVARAEPAPAETRVPGLTKQSIILFAKDAADPADSALANIKLLATQLNAAMVRPDSRVQIHAYGGPKGDKGSDARRLSLKRALAIRQVLIDDGVPAERIDVRAMGGVDDSGPTDRVDVYTKA